VLVFEIRRVEEQSFLGVFVILKRCYTVVYKTIGYISEM